MAPEQTHVSNLYGAVILLIYISPHQRKRLVVGWSGLVWAGFQVRSSLVVRDPRVWRCVSLLELETGIAKSLRHGLPIDVDLSAPNSAAPDPDPVFVQTTNWLLCEAGPPVPEMAAATRKATDPPARAALADLAGSEPAEDAVIVPLAHAYYEQLGYEPSIAGALVAVCDMFFGRITDGGVHPAVGAGCIAWYWWMTEDLPDHQVVRACHEVSQRWRRASQPRVVENEICAMATAWQADHRSHVPVIA